MRGPDKPDRENSGGDPDSPKRFQVILPLNSEGISLTEIVGDTQPQDVAKFRSEIASVRRRLRAAAKNRKQLSSDTFLLIKNTTELPPPKTVSSNDIGWQQKLNEIQIGAEGIFIIDAYTVEDIKFVSAFAAKHQLLVDYGHGSFRLTRRGQ